MRKCSGKIEGWSVCDVVRKVEDNEHIYTLLYVFYTSETQKREGLCIISFRNVDAFYYSRSGMLGACVTNIFYGFVLTMHTAGPKKKMREGR